MHRRPGLRRPMPGVRSIATSTRQRAQQMTFRLRPDRRRGWPPTAARPIHRQRKPDRARQVPGTNSMINRLSAPGTILAAIVLLAGCAATYRPDRGSEMATLPTAPLKAPQLSATRRRPRGPLPEGTETTKVFRAPAYLVKGGSPGGALPASVVRSAVATGPSVTLNFEGAELRGSSATPDRHPPAESYTIDPSVGDGDHTHDLGHSREALPATLEMILRSNGATMVKEGAIWKVVPAATAVQNASRLQLGNGSRALTPGTASRSCRSIRRRAADDDDPRAFQKDATTMHADDLRNLLIVSGTELELRHMLETIDMFDVNWLAACRWAYSRCRRGRQDRRRRARQGDGTAGQEPVGGHPAHYPDRADERAARRHAAAGVPRGSEAVDRPAGQGRCRRRRPLLRLPGTEQPRRAHRPAAAAGVHRPYDPADDGRPSDLGAGHAGRDYRLPAELSGPAFVFRPGSGAAADDDRPAAGHAAAGRGAGRAGRSRPGWPILRSGRRQRRRRAQRQSSPTRTTPS